MCWRGWLTLCARARKTASARGKQSTLRAQQGERALPG